MTAAPASGQVTIGRRRRPRGRGQAERPGDASPRETQGTRRHAESLQIAVSPLPYRLLNVVPCRPGVVSGGIRSTRAVLAAVDGEAIELYVRVRTRKRFLADVRADEPDWPLRFGSSRLS